MMEKTGRQRYIIWIFAGLLVLGFLVFGWRQFFGFNKNDEIFYISTVYRFFQGDAMLIDEWNNGQLFAFITYPIFMLVRLFHNSNDGIVLIFRFLYLFFQAAVATYCFVRLKRFGWIRIFPALFYFVTTPYNINALSYNTLVLGFVLLALVTVASADEIKTRDAVLCGVFIAGAVLSNPYAVILFDEIEKAHPDVFNILLQVLDDGHITDSQGRRVDFKNTVIIMTSNAGASAIVTPKKLGFASSEDARQDYEFMKNSVMNEVKQLFRPEFLNRIDEVIVFHMLQKDEISRIAGMLLDELEKRCERQLSIHVSFKDSVKKWLAEIGYDAKYGARPLKRAIQNRLEDLMADEILSGKIHEGDRVDVKVAGGKVKITVKAEERA